MTADHSEQSAQPDRRPDDHRPTERSTGEIPISGASAGAPQQTGPFPLLAGLFAAQFARERAVDDGGAPSGAMPDVLLDPAHATGALGAELDRMTVTIPRLAVWGPLEGVDTTEDGYAVRIGGDTIEIPASERLHISERAYREAGGAPVAQYSADAIAQLRDGNDPRSLLFQERDDPAPDENTAD